MDIKQISLKEFIHLPIGQKLTTVVAVIIIVMSNVIVYQAYENKRLERERNRIEFDRGEEKRKCGEDKVLMAQYYQRKSDERSEREIAELKERAAKREARQDAVLEEARLIFENQKKTLKNVRRATKTVSKIVQNEN